MNFRQWILGVAAAGLAFGAAGAQAAPMFRTGVDAPAAVQNVQFYYEEYYYEPPPAYYGPPRRYYRPAPPPPAYYPPPPAYHPSPAYGGFYDKETTKAYRKAQKEIHKERVRAWNRANGY